MKFRARTALLAILFSLPSAALAADLASAYDAILRGDYAHGRTAVASAKSAAPDIARVQGWLDHFDDVIAKRSELRAETFDWNSKKAQEALAAGEVYFALAFAVQASAYTDDDAALVAEPWMQDLIHRARTEADACAQAGTWSRALAYYAQLARLMEKDKEISALRDDAMLHARLELTYKDDKAIAERIRGVNDKLLRDALRQIDRMYFEQPDLKRVTLGAITNIEALCNTIKLYKHLDGIANRATREFFLKKLADIQARIEKSERVTNRDLRAVFDEIASASKESVELPRELLIVEFVEGAISKLDEFTSMVWPADSTEFDKMMMGGFEGVGIQLGKDDITSRLKVVTPLEDSPALEAGIHPDDLIVEVDGKDTKGWTTDDAVHNIMGPAGSNVVLTMFRPSTGEYIPFQLTRRRIVLRSVRGVERSVDGWNYMLDADNGIAYIRLTNFQPDSGAELRRALDAASAQGMRGLVLDLRNNPGGLLNTAVEIVSLFQKTGEVVHTRGRQESETHIPVNGQAAFADMPLVVLVNEGSASASEILAGSLQDHNRAFILGDRTFGKGSVQQVLQVGDAARFKLTTALYYLPRGSSPHKAPDSEEWGIEPDMTVKLTPKEFRRVMEREREAYIIRNGDESHETAKGGPSGLDTLKDTTKNEDDEEPLLSDTQIKQLDSDPHKAPNVDPQLETALLHLRVKLAANVPWPRKVASIDKKTSTR